MNLPTRWLVEWATARITGEAESHSPVKYDWTADTNYRDLPQR